MDPYQPQPADRFTFGLWTVGNVGRDPFGDPVRAAVAAPDTVRMLADLGAHGVNFHDDDLVPIGASASERDRIVADFRCALEETGMKVPMATTNLFSDPAFRDGAFTNPDPAVRAYALQKTLQAMDLGTSLGATTYVFWGGREGTEVDAGRDALEALKWFREALNYLRAYADDQGFPGPDGTLGGLRFALEPKPNEPRGDIFLPTVGSALAFIETLDAPDKVGVNPEVAHDTMAGLNFVHAVAQAWDAGKLFHIDLNDQNPGRYDQDFRFGAFNPKTAFALVRFLEGVGYDGPLHFDAHAYRTSDAEDVTAFAAGCMRTYLVLKDKARQFAEDAEIQALLTEVTGTDDAAGAALVGPDGMPAYSADGAAVLRAHLFDRAALGCRGRPYERLDQLTNDVLMGVR